MFSVNGVRPAEKIALFQNDRRVTFGVEPDGTVQQLTTTLFLQKIYGQDAVFVRAG